MIDSGTGGSIVNVSSIMGERGQRNPGRTPYNTSKGAMNNLTRCLAVEWAEHDITVNALAPGYIKTKGTEESLADTPFSDEDIVDQTPLGRWGSPEEMGTCVAFLARDDNFVTGEILHADGGWTAFA
jgi:3-oxoacyl-[acyl-carrier protein] reductase